MDFDGLPPLTPNNNGNDQPNNVENAQNHMNAPQPAVGGKC